MLNSSPGDPSSLLDSSVQIGTPFTFVQTIDANAQLVVGGGYESGSNFVSSLRVGDYDFEAAGNSTGIRPSTIVFLPTVIDGQDQGLYNTTFKATLIPISTVSEPDPNLNTLLQYSISDFSSGSSVLLGEFGMNSAFQALLVGNVSLFSAVETPEPSTWALFLGGLGLMAFWRRVGNNG